MFLLHVFIHAHTPVSCGGQRTAFRNVFSSTHVLAWLEVPSLAEDSFTHWTISATWMWTICNRENSLRQVLLMSSAACDYRGIKKVLAVNSGLRLPGPICGSLDHCSHVPGTQSYWHVASETPSYASHFKSQLVGRHVAGSGFGSVLPEPEPLNPWLWCPPTAVLVCLTHVHHRHVMWSDLCIFELQLM